MLEHYPRRYDEWKDIVPVSQLEEGEISAIEGTLTARPQMKVHGKLKILTVQLQDATGVVNITWYNMPFLRNQLKMGTRYILRGKVVKKYQGLGLEQPSVVTREEFYRKVGTLTPVYPLTSGITNNAFVKAQTAVITGTEGIQEFLPADIRKRQGLMGYKRALRNIHFPVDWTFQKEARKRLAFDELFLYALALSYMKQNKKQESQFVMMKDHKTDSLRKSLPYELTSSQKKVWAELCQDMKSRILHEPPGTGRCWMRGKRLWQLWLCAWRQKTTAGRPFMVPTEVLANQHYRELKKLLEPLDIPVVLLSGAQKTAEKREVKKQIRDKTAMVVVGTHAVIQDDVEFCNLGLVITDEQHRFGVKQRETLFQKGREPHVLAMSATPIPRTLALILYGDMDLSVMEKPPASRLPVKNCVVNTEYRRTAYKFMQDEIEKEHQVYVICPMVEEGEEGDLQNVLIYTERLKGIFPPGVVVEGLHGKMKPAVKDDIMERFAAGQIQILVSTTVIEVGIDVPNATVILIENAERFGLAQLHQLRGRVGRGSAQSYCILMTGKDSKESRQRLDILAGSNDGFYIAREDLKLRGQGDLFGVRQSGQQLFKLADIFEDSTLLERQAKEAGLSYEDESHFCIRRIKD